ncbi:MAG: SgcJ/EcaC family oxidoreductase [Chthoniobacterales bacterium]
MRTKTLLITVALGLATAANCLAAEPQLEQALRELDAQWSTAAAAKDLEKTVSYYSDDATVLPPNSPAATTKDAIRKVWQETFAITVSGSWKATRVEVSQSGDMAWVTGTYDWKTKDAGGKTTSDHGNYLAVYEKQADGAWKCGADVWNSDLPLPASTAPEKK